MVERAIENKGDIFLEEAFRSSMRELNDFFGINWTDDLPKIHILSDRKSIDLQRGKQTEPWVVGWSDKDSVFLLSRENYETESNHKYDEAKYLALLKHELSHCFFRRLSGMNSGKPIWLNEGVAIYTSGQNRFKKKPEKFESFLSFNEAGGSRVYGEAGFIVELLVDKFGRGKILELIKSLGEISSTEFDERFKRIYGFNPSYVEFNEMIS